MKSAQPEIKFVLSDSILVLSENPPRFIECILLPIVCFYFLLARLWHREEQKHLDYLTKYCIDYKGLIV